MQKCKAFLTAFLQTLQITYRLDHNEEGHDSGLKVLSGLPIRIHSLYVHEQYVLAVPMNPGNVVSGSKTEVHRLLILALGVVPETTHSGPTVAAYINNSLTRKNDPPPYLNDSTPKIAHPPVLLLQSVWILCQQAEPHVCSTFRLTSPVYI